MLPDTLDGAADYFTFGGDSLGFVLCLTLAILVFCGFIWRTIALENHNHGHSLTEEDMTPSPFTPPHEE
ncbi:MAG: hypothetical protein JHC95_18650 [Solirubrobacteraceae bacterium]|nr:hypothetical protein [Solirubrobacteraceae bacterium]